MRRGKWRWRGEKKEVKKLAKVNMLGMEKYGETKVAFYSAIVGNIGLFFSFFPSSIK